MNGDVTAKDLDADAGPPAVEGGSERFDQGLPDAADSSAHDLLGYSYVEVTVEVEPTPPPSR